MLEYTEGLPNGSRDVSVQVRAATSSSRPDDGGSRLPRLRANSRGRTVWFAHHRASGTGATSGACRSAVRLGERLQSHCCNSSLRPLGRARLARSVRLSLRSAGGMALRKRPRQQVSQCQGCAHSTRGVCSHWMRPGWPLLPSGIHCGLREKASSFPKDGAPRPTEKSPPDPSA